VSVVSDAGDATEEGHGEERDLTPGYQHGTHPHHPLLQVPCTKREEEN